MRFLFIFLFTLWAGNCHGSQANYLLSVTFDPEKGSMTGEATISFPPGESWELDTHGLKIHSVITQEQGKKSVSLPIPAGNSLSMYAAKHSQTVTVTYSLQPRPQQFDNVIGSDAIVLTHAWHPVPDRPMVFALTAKLPTGFKGISEADTIDIVQNNNVLKTHFSQPVQAIHLAAAPYAIQQIKIRENLSLTSWFFGEDKKLSDDYLTAAQRFIERYEQAIGPFPYPHYAIVANRLPTGYGMPTFTLLGQMVLRLPFMKEISLGHEILHSWFGNSIGIASDSGNWCEGLTSYLADFSYAEDKGQGAQHRKNSLLNYQSYVHQASAIPLQDFHSASHNQPMAKAVRAVGYNRGAMLFHQLRGLLGPEDFFMGIRYFAANWKGKEASWDDIQTAFEKVSSQNLSTFFNEQLNRTDLPQLTVTDVSVETKADITTLHFSLHQSTTKPYSLQLPIHVETFAGVESFTRSVTEKETKISITLSQEPLAFTIDPDYDLFRALDSSESPAIWSRFLGSQQKLIVTDEQDQAVFSPLLQWAVQQGWPTISSDKLTNQQLTEHSLLFTNSNNSAYKSLFGSAAAKQPGFHLRVQNNPLNEKEVIVLLDSSSIQETKSALRKLKHYGKYSILSFHKGRNQQKAISTSENGLHIVLATPPVGGSTGAVQSFDAILDQLATKDIIYLGETHNSLADHLLQLRIIQGLAKKGLTLAVAMEMFPQNSQQSLDDFVLSKTIDEATFLRQSKWFDVWRYDWRLFRPIFTFCRRADIPVHGINVDRAIVSTVFSKGHTDDLSEEQQAAIAAERDLSLTGYVDRLKGVHTMHNQSPHGEGKGFSGFIQSQAIWDESMAANIVQIRKEHPSTTIVVIAGSQHTRKDSGIPPRVKRRLDVTQASVINLYAENAPIRPEREADYFFLEPPVFLPPQGKIGVILSPEKDEEGADRLRIKELSHAGKAKEAGIKQGDIIVSIEGTTIETMEDINIVMTNARAGDILKMKLKRDTAANQELQEIDVRVELSDLTKPPSHP